MKEIYSLRKSFSIIGLTGVMGSGCSTLANVLSQTKEEFFSNPRHLRSLNSFTEVKNHQVNIFRRKYSICYSFVKENYIQYQVIDYKKVLLLYCINFFKKESGSNAFVEFIHDVFKKSEKSDQDFPDIEIDNDKLLCLTEKYYNEIAADLQLIVTDITEVKDEAELRKLYDIYFDQEGAFSIFCESLFKLFNETNRYLRTFFFHKVSNNIRSSGCPYRYEEKSDSNIYNLVKLINRIIKSYKSQNLEKCHIVIDSLKNSLEIMFFKERYSAFYIVALHNEGYKERITKKITQDENYKITLSKLLELDRIEYKSEDFKRGVFWAPDIQNCIQKSEIHFHNIENTIESLKEFVSIHEQVLKFQSLLQQPGIITPTNLERCMQVAYNSKFSSGCISRQVGAVVTDENYSIKSVGWNDVPKSNTPCLLKDLKEVIDPSLIINEDKTYSDFELSVDEEHFYSLNKNRENSKFKEKTFSQNVIEEYKSILQEVDLEGRNCAYCFKSLHNKFEGEQNQVHTRSLHAEENAMLQISKYGGQALNEGILFTTASPCELCSKKAYQLGIKRIIYIDKYPGISMSHVLGNGFDAPKLESFKGFIGKSYNKLYEPFISYKDELSLLMKQVKEKES